MSKLSVFQFSFGDGYAGSARIALQSSELLSHKGHQVKLFVSKNSLTEKRGTEAGLNIFSTDSSKPFNLLKEEIFGEYLRIRPDIVIGHHSLDRKIGIALKKKFRKNIINIAYRHNISKSFPLVGSLIYNLYSDYLIACSRGVRDSLVSSGVKEKKVKVIYNGIEIPENLESITGDTVRKKYSLNGKKVLGLSTWFHKERKGFDILFKSFSVLNSDYVLLLAGITGEDKETVLNYASEFGISKDKIIMPGYVNNIWEFYKAMDIFLLPSRSEGFSLALLEAAAANIPIIASNIPGNNEFIKNGVNGVLFNIDKPEELSSGIERLFNDKRLGKVFSACALRNVMSSYTMKHYGAALEEFLSEAVQTHK